MDKRDGIITQSDSSLTKSTLVWKPSTLPEALAQKEHLSGEGASYIAGGTLMQLQREQGTPLAHHLISLEKIQELNEIKYVHQLSKRYLQIGSLTPLAVCQSNQKIQDEWSLLSVAAKEVASPAVRNRGTIGGNIAYGIGDTIPALLALDAKISWFDGTKQTTSLLWDYLQSPTSKDSLIASIQLPTQPLSSNVMTFYRKVGRRESFIPSLVTAAVVCCFNSDGRIDYIRIGVAGGASAPQRLENCEQFLFDEVIDNLLLDIVYKKIMEEFTPKSDPFVSAEYKQTVAANLIVSELEKFIDN